jgi:site-specific recombinase XerC
LAEFLPSKQVVAGSSPVSRSTLQAQTGCEQFTKFTKDTLEKFLNSRAAGTSPKTITIYHLALDRFIGYPLSPEGIKAFLDSLKCGNAKHNYFRVIRTLCRWLHRTEEIPANPIEKVLPPRRQKRLLPAISKAQLDILVSHCPTQKDRVILNLLWYSGMRLFKGGGGEVRPYEMNKKLTI